MGACDTPWSRSRCEESGTDSEEHDDDGKASEPLSPYRAATAGAHAPSMYES